MILTSTSATYGVRSTSPATSSGATGGINLGQPETQISLPTADVAWTGQVLLVQNTSAAKITLNLGTATVSPTWNGESETVTIVATGGCTSNGALQLEIEATGLVGSPVYVNVALTTAAHTTAALIAGAARAALSGTAAITAMFTVGGTGVDVVLTNANAELALFNLKVYGGLGVTGVVESTHTYGPLLTSPWVAGSGEAETSTFVGRCTANGTLTLTITAAGMTVKNVAVALTTAAHNTAALVAAACRTAISANATITAMFTVGGPGAAVVLTRIGKRYKMANSYVEVHTGTDDATFNVAIPSNALGITAATTSDHTDLVLTSGVLHRDCDGKDWEGSTLPAIAAGRIGALQIASDATSTSTVAMASTVGFAGMPLPPGGFVLVGASGMNSTTSHSLALTTAVNATSAFLTISVVGSSV